MTDDNAQVTYTIKELFERLEDKIDKFYELVEQKASNQRVDNLEAQVHLIADGQERLRRQAAKFAGGAAAIIAVIELGSRFF